MAGGIFFTFRFKWINLRGFKHSIQVTMGRYDNPEDKGEISHFRALTSALSATVGLGNIAGVAVAIYFGGPGAVFWMIFMAIFGMTSKFASCTLSQLYRKENRDGTISGGPMYYLDLGLKSLGPRWKAVGKTLGLMYAFMIMFAAIGGGNMFQANQTVEAFISTFQLGDSFQVKAAMGTLMAVFVALVVLGGIKSIGAATARIVPTMVVLYIGASLFIIFSNFSLLPETLMLIVKTAFTQNAFFGGMVGVFIQGIKRAAFSSEAGLGSASIAHAAAKTEEPIREGIVAMLGPFIDTVVICLITALVIIITGTWNNPEIDANGVVLTTYAFHSVLPWFPKILAVCIGLFAYSTMLSWNYYGERGWIYLLDHLGGVGLKSVIIFRLIFVFFVFFGSIASFTDVLNAADLMILSTSFPNILGVIILSSKVSSALEDYWRRYKSGEMKIAQK